MEIEGVNEGLSGLLRSGLPFPVNSLCVAGELVIVLFNSDAWLKKIGPIENLRCYSFDSTEKWRAALPTTTTGDHFASLSCSGLHAIATYSFSGFDITIDTRTGKELDRKFVK